MRKYILAATVFLLFVAISYLAISFYEHEDSIQDETKVEEGQFAEQERERVSEVGPRNEAVDGYLSGVPTQRSFYKNGTKHVNIDNEVHDQMRKREAWEDEAIESLDARRDFSFRDGLEDSGITFEHEAVPDRAKYTRANHYNHGNGMAVADVTGNGYLDIYFTNQIGANELWLNNGDGSFDEITEPAGVGVRDSVTSSASFGDLNNNGKPDLYVTVIRDENRLFRNEGDGEFTEVSEESNINLRGHSGAAVFFDYNGNGKLDMFLTNVGEFTMDEKSEQGHYVGRDRIESSYVLDDGLREANLLYENTGGMTFRNVTDSVGLGDGGWSGDATPVYYDGNEYPGLYVLDMEGDDVYYRNINGEKFVESTNQTFGLTPLGSMGVKQFDYNNDGRMELYVIDKHSDRSTGVVDLEDEKRKIERTGELDPRTETPNIYGNAFYEKRGGQMVERSDELNLENYWPWGASVGDVNANGYPDIYVTAGMNYDFRYQPSYLMLNDVGTGFAHAEFTLGLEPRDSIFTEWYRVNCGKEEHPRCGTSGDVKVETPEGNIGSVEYEEEKVVMAPKGSRSSVMFDLDNTGDLDIVTNEFNSEPRVMVSNLAERHGISYLKIELEGTESNRDGLGARVEVRANRDVYTKYNDGQSGYLSQSSKPLYFGLGEHDAVDEVYVRWPSGNDKKYTLEDINQTVVLREDGGYSAKRR